jgi:hypothetical protein
MAQENSAGFSAAVRIWLVAGDKQIQLSHASSTFVIAKEATDLPPGNAQIICTIDGERFERPVHLVNGMTSKCREAMVLSRDLIPF